MLFERWDDWYGDEEGSTSRDDGPCAALDHLEQDQTGRRLIVRGLPPMINQLQNDVEMRDLFEGFAV